MKNIKIFILGAKNVGKTSLIHQIVFGDPSITERFRQQYCRPTIEDVYFATLDYSTILPGAAGHQLAGTDNNSKNANSSSHRQQSGEDRLLFFDVAGIQQNIDIEQLKSYISYADEFILVYSINDRPTFNLVDTIKKLVDLCKGKRDHPIIVLGNKVDLDAERQVDFDDSLVWAKRENVKLFEVTSLERATLADFTKYLASQLTAPPSHSSSAFKLRRSKTNQSTTSG